MLADEGATALELLESHPVTLLISDVVMPGMNCRQFADLALSKNPGLKELLVTGYSRNAIVHHGVLDSGTKMLMKSFSLEVLARKLTQMLLG